MKTEKELWRAEVIKEVNSLVDKSKSIRSKIQSLEDDREKTRKRLLEARIKFAFNTRENNWRENNISNFKKWHATRGWLEESRDPIPGDYMIDETVTLFVNVSNDRETYKCQIKTDDLPRGCKPFVADGYEFDIEACMDALPSKRLKCDRWSITPTRYRSPPRGQLTGWTPKAI